ncbi:sensor domain-containing diguanylate cyclase [Butyrivibrio sp. VCD2006]|uniref:sensor domain-containing diguanylate cyclase n=1 Tax=Butyrivibrio sp. VCD2006 TaxID=1280664 RepID=UPI0004190B05|nr:sensor domain-containing diguanylate cyclase [Butyrivibrio sp. VCD2006]
MDYQSWIEGINELASLYSFDILSDGSFSEIRLMAVNQMNDVMLHMVPDAPEFYPGIPYRSYWMDLNFESYIYKCASSAKPLYSYVNARGVWLKGFYLPIADIWGEYNCPPLPKGAHRVYCLYVVNFTEQAQTDSMAQRSPEVAGAVLDIGIRLHEATDFYESLANTAAQVKEFCGARMCSMYLVDKVTRECTFVSEDGVHDLEEFASEMGRTPFEVAEIWEKDLALSDCLLLQDLKIIEERDPEWYRSMLMHGVQNIVFYAIRYNQTLVGYIWAANYDVAKTEQIKETLELSTFMLAAVIANHFLISRLEVKSAMDALTQVGNRNAMDDYVKSIEKGTAKLPKTLGVIFADLNGLKRKNDEEGHDAGDRMLVRSSSLLKVVFGENLIYRAGGDEFVIFCEDISEEQMRERISRLKMLADSNLDVSFAIGSVFCEGSYDIGEAVQKADELMYQDKKEYYQLHSAT